MIDAHGAGVDAARHMVAAYWSAATAARAASVTIALRLPILMQAAVDPFAWPARREAVRAATEKWEAAFEGAMGAWAASTALWRDLLLRPADARALGRDLAAMSSAALRPARARVRGNARRLTRG